MGSLSPVHWAIVIVVVLLLFGSRKLPDMARGLGQSMRILKAETRGLQEDDRAHTSSAPGQPGSSAPRRLRDRPRRRPPTGRAGPLTRTQPQSGRRARSATPRELSVAGR